MSKKRLVKIIVGDGSPIVSFKPDRNKLCECGSGRKQKKCCGDDTKFYSTKPKPKKMFKTDGEGNQIEV